MTVEPEVLLNRGGEDNRISRKENRENVTGIDKSRHLYICEAGEGVLSGLDNHGPEEGASSNAHYCPVGTNQTKEKVTQATKNGGEGRKVQMKEAISNRERAVKQRRNLGKLETISEEDDHIVGKSMDGPETKLEPKLQVQNTRPLIDPLPEVRNNRDVKLKDTVFYTNEAPRRMEVMGRQEKTTNISALELTTEDSAVNNEQEEPTVEEKQTDVVTSSLSLLLFSITMPSLDIYNDVSLLESLHKRHWNCFSVIVTALSFNFVFTCIAWWRIEPRCQKTWSWIFLLLQIWPQLKACQV